MIVKWELYNLEIDPFEKINVVDDYPEKAKTLLHQYEKWSVEHGVRDWPLHQN